MAEKGGVSEWVERIRLVIRSARTNVKGRELREFLLSWIPLKAAAVAVPAIFLAAVGIAAQAEGVLLDESCAAVTVEFGGEGGAAPLNHIWGEIDGRVNAIFKIGGLTYAIPAEAIPSNAIPAEAKPSSAIPAEAIPSNAIPRNLAIPSNAIPSNLLPSWVVAEAMPQVAAGGFLRLEGGAVLSHTWMKDDRGVHMGFTLNGIPYEMSREKLESALAAGAIPAEAIPAEAIPSNAIPAEAIPSNAIPSNLVYVPEGAIPSNVFVGAIPAEGIPSDAIPAEAIPAEAIPSNAIPAEAIPSNFVSAIPPNVVVSMLSATEMLAIPAESWSQAAQLGIPSNQVPPAADQMSYTEMAESLPFETRSMALPSNALPSNALPSNALPSNALPSNALPMFKLFAGDGQPPPDILVVRRSGPPTLVEALLDPFKARFDADRSFSVVSTTEAARSTCADRNGPEDESIVQSFVHSFRIAEDGTISGSISQAEVCPPGQAFLGGWGCYRVITATVSDPEPETESTDSGVELAAPDPGPGQEFGGLVGDSDGDGWLNEDDCAPFDRKVYPFADEVYGDGVDNDCDGQIDEGFAFEPTTELIPADEPTVVAGGPVEPTTSSDSGSSDSSGSSGSDSSGTEYGEVVPTLSVSKVYMYGPSTIEESWVFNGTEQCNGPYWTEVDLWLDAVTSGTTGLAVPGDVSSVGISWSGGGVSGSKSMSYTNTPGIWSASLGPFGVGTVSADAAITVTAHASNAAGSASGSTLFTLRRCSSAGEG